MTESQLLEKVLLYGGNRVKDLVQSVPLSLSQVERAASHFPLSWRERKQNFNSKFFFPPLRALLFLTLLFGSRTPRRAIILIALPFAHPIFFYTLRKVNASFDCRVDSEMSPPPICYSRIIVWLSPPCRRSTRGDLKWQSALLCRTTSIIPSGNQPHMFCNQPNTKSAISERSSTDEAISQKEYNSNQLNTISESLYSCNQLRALLDALPTAHHLPITATHYFWSITLNSYYSNRCFSTLLRNPPRKSIPTGPSGRRANLGRASPQTKSPPSFSSPGRRRSV